MIKVIEYQCDICRTRYSTEEGALACERKKVFNPSQFIVGAMFEYHHNGYVGIFAIPPGGATPFNGPNNSHLGNISYWACRVSCNDSLNHLCGGDLVYSDDVSMIKYWHFRRLTTDKVGSPEFKRMVAHLRSKGIQPCYYNEHDNLIVL